MPAVSPIPLPPKFMAPSVVEDALKQYLDPWASKQLDSLLTPTHAPRGRPTRAYYYHYPRPFPCLCATSLDMCGQARASSCLCYTSCFGMAAFGLWPNVVSLWQWLTIPLPMLEPHPYLVSLSIGTSTGISQSGPTESWMATTSQLACTQQDSLFGGCHCQSQQTLLEVAR